MVIQLQGFYLQCSESVLEGHSTTLRAVWAGTAPTATHWPNWHIEDGATDHSDYAFASDPYWAAAQGSAFAIERIIRAEQDSWVEGDETFTVSFTTQSPIADPDDPDYDAACTITIIDDDQAASYADGNGGPVPGGFLNNPSTLGMDSQWELRCRPGVEGAREDDPVYVSEGADFTIQATAHKKRSIIFGAFWDTEPGSAGAGDYSVENSEHHDTSRTTLNHTFHTQEDDVVEGPQYYWAGFDGAY